jgi:hypothetical protein
MLPDVTDMAFDADAWEFVADRFGLMGLLGVIRMTDQDLNTLALGCDLTTLGLNLNAAEYVRIIHFVLLSST